MVEKTSSDTRATLSETQARIDNMLREAQQKADALVAEGQAKLKESEQAAKRQAAEILENARNKSNEIKRTALMYREHILSSVENEKRIVAELNTQIGKLRSGWLDSQSAISELVASVGSQFVRLEGSVADVTREIANKRSELTSILTDMTVTINEEAAGKE